MPLQNQHSGGREPGEHVKIYNLPMNDDEPSASASKQIKNFQTESTQRPTLLKSASTPGKIHNLAQRKTPNLKRTQSIKERISNETAKFFGVSMVVEQPTVNLCGEPELLRTTTTTTDQEERKWQQRRFRHLNKQYRIRRDAVEKELQPKIENDGLLDLMETCFMDSSALSPSIASLRARSIDGARRRWVAEKRETVAQMTLNTLSAILHGDVFRKSRSCRRAADTLKTPSVRGPSTPLSTYRPIRERNQCARNSSFPSNRINAATLEGLARANLTMRKISGFFSANVGSEEEEEEKDNEDAPPPPTQTTLSPLEMEIKAISVPKFHLHDSRQNSPHPQRKFLEESAESARSENGSSDLPPIGPKLKKPDSPKSMKRKLTYALDEKSPGINEFYATGLAKTLPSNFAIERPNFLPLAKQQKQQISASVAGRSSQNNRKDKQNRMFISSSSITDDDVFFDIVPNLKTPNAASTTLKSSTNLENRPSTKNLPKILATNPNLMEKQNAKFSSFLDKEGEISNIQPKIASDLNSSSFSRMEQGREEFLNENLSSTTQNLKFRPDFLLGRQKELSESSDVEEGVVASPSTQSQILNFTRIQALQEQIRSIKEQRKNALFSAFEKPKKPERSLAEWLWLLLRFDCLRGTNVGIRSLVKFNFSTRPTPPKKDQNASFGQANSTTQQKQSPKRKLPMFGQFKKTPTLDPEVVRQLRDESSDYRPFFTYWITTVQCLIMLFTLFNYGIGTDFRSLVIERSGNVMASYHSVVRIVVWEQNNVWIGPRFADLIHLGAKYAPCMRRDPRIYKQIYMERAIEAKETGCCIAADGCYQTSECPKQFARLIHWTNYTHNNQKRPIRVVCGNDPRFCPTKNKEGLIEKFDPINIAEWPICENGLRIARSEEHMHCEITGRPCCIQMHGQCRITTQHYCDFVRGYYHSKATLCSQVNCLNDVCGMTPFINAEYPDQIYRLLAPLFIHAGILRCIITILLQMSVMRQFESMIGWHRLCIIYFVSGIGGYLASAIFVPYMPEVGPAGSQGGVLGALIVNVLYNWNYLLNPRKVILWHLLIAAILFFTGFAPFIDNWAQLFGFIFGCLLAAALVPYINFGPRTRQRRLLIVAGSLSITIILFLILFILFYTYPILNYEFFSWFNCPFPGSKVCDHQGLILRSWLPI